MADGVTETIVRMCGVAEQDQAQAATLDLLRKGKVYVIATLDGDANFSYTAVLPEIDALPPELRAGGRMVALQFLSLISLKLLEAAELFQPEEDGQEAA